MGYKLGQYTPGSSVIHRLDPRVKIVAVMLLSITVLRADAFIAIAITILIAGITFIARLSPSHLLRAVKPLAIFFVLIFLMHLFFTPGAPIPLPLATYEGLYRGVLLTWRFVFLILSAAILTMTTTPSELMSGIERLLRPLRPLGISSHDAAVMVSMVLRFVPTLLQELDQIREAQMARGADFKAGNLLARMKRISSLVIPLVRNSILRAEELAIGMEGRGYHRGPRTYMRELRMTPSDYTILVVLMILTGLGVYRW
ncbi:energy-coupling factor transporter transmembrane protein EcfT [Dehalococcoidia bacterium]|nr:energy-coupling factor transporter transmembrane protein EcfT [Dehalococcoidia bacterium]MCL0094126.1 energy-coupling factor transporter transmembrane protein EcfT [Dehalococcoidia bacterium]